MSTIILDDFTIDLGDITIKFEKNSRSVFINYSYGNKNYYLLPEDIKNMLEEYFIKKEVIEKLQK